MGNFITVTRLSMISDLCCFRMFCQRNEPLGTVFTVYCFLTRLSAKGFCSVLIDVFFFIF